ncbi:acyl carrier protein [Streptomyces natalensis]|uniref:Carrier domain-containing protein n=1 Tax=Streptomyces natalensis ATCC 27448 TaxID=1240678 RepID=A0A0D7CHA7_9ACTN|nr:acyl carrier protein [Streptomyces natalensis]KIZ15659.1 hypothetical protein SNA_25265 [Streptomyces natalensis ATCC 27448]
MSGGLFGGPEDMAGQARDAVFQAAGGTPGVREDGPRNTAETVRDTLYQAAGGRLDDEPLIAQAKVIMADMLECEAQALRPEADLATDLGADEMTLINLAAVLEMELDIDELYEDVHGWKTVDDVLDSVHEQTA